MSVERLESERNLWMATVRPDGRPHVAPVWFVYVDGHVWVGTGANSVRVRNLRTNPSASVTLESGDAPVVAEGTAVVHDAQRPPAVAAAFAAKYQWDITVDVDDDLGQVVLVEFTPSRWLFGIDLPVG